jgi:hypothetical protein
VGPTRQRGGRPLQRTGSGMVAGLRARIATGPKRFPEIQNPIFILLLLFSFLFFPFSFYSDFSLSFEEFSPIQK